MKFWSAYTFGTTGRIYFYFRYSIAVCLSFCWFLQQCTTKSRLCFRYCESFFTRRIAMQIKTAEKVLIWFCFFHFYSKRTPNSSHSNFWSETNVKTHVGSNIFQTQNQFQSQVGIWSWPNLHKTNLKLWLKIFRDLGLSSKINVGIKSIFIPSDSIVLISTRFQPEILILML